MDKRVDCYRNQTNLALGPEILMPRTLGILLDGCDEKNIEKIKRGIAVLREGLNFSKVPLTALRLCQIYNQMEVLALNKNFNGIARTLNQLLSFFPITNKSSMDE